MDRGRSTGAIEVIKVLAVVLITQVGGSVPPVWGTH
jgi:hypothetical protein